MGDVWSYLGVLWVGCGLEDGWVRMSCMLRLLGFDVDIRLRLYELQRRKTS